MAVRCHGTRFNRRDYLLTAGVSGVLGAGAPANAAGNSVYDFTVQQYGEDVSMSRYSNEVIVIVNVASE